MTRRSASLQVKHGVVLALALVGVIPYGWLAVWSFLLGGGIQVVNLTLLERGVRALLGAGSAAPAAQVVLLARTALLFAAVLLVLARSDVAPLWFLAGLLAIVPASLWHGLSARSLEG